MEQTTSNGGGTATNPGPPVGDGDRPKHSPHYHLTHRSEVDGEVFNSGQEREVWSSRESATHRIDRIIRDIQCRRHVIIFREQDWVQISWHDQHAISHQFRLIECSRLHCVEPIGLKGTYSPAG